MGQVSNVGVFRGALASPTTAETTPPPQEEAKDTLASTLGFATKHMSYALGTPLATPSEDELVGRNERPSWFSPFSGVGPVGAAMAGTAVAAPFLAAQAGQGLAPSGVMGVAKTAGVGALGAGFKLTPSIVASVAGPGVADVVTYLAPNMLPKYKKDMPANKKSEIQFLRGAVGAAAVTAAAFLVFLKFPKVFGLANQNALEGVRNATQGVIAAGGANVGGNRSAIFAVGGLTTAVLAMQAANAVTPEEKQDKMKWAVLAAGVTGAGMLLAPYLTRGANLAEAAIPLNATAEEARELAKLSNSSSLTRALDRMKVGAVLNKVTPKILPNSGFGLLPLSLEPIKQFGLKVAPITSVPAYDSAFKYFEVFDALGNAVNNKTNTPPPKK